MAAAVDSRVQTSLGFRLDPSLGGVDHIQIGKHFDLKNEWHEVHVHDLSGREREFKLDEAGFEFVRHHTAINDFDDHQQVTSDYYDEIARLTKDVTGATFAHCYQHGVRSSDAKGFDNGRIGIARGLHVDYNYTGPPEYIRTLPERPTDWDRLSRYQWAIYSVWRPTARVTRDALCVGDKRTIPDHDLVEGSTDMTAPDRKQKNHLFWVNYSANHQYYYKLGMDVDDVLLIKLYDSRDDGRARCSPHTAFTTAEDHGAARESIEVRCIAVWEDNGKD